ncbi:MAG: chloramphenicol-sensitive protein RarD [Sphingomonadales bacterium]|jgi:chloramphenicol-sensitive protein RarD|nr:chloramphenicol-sensitive protein RarD [Sphingomonadales bacterium]
MTNDHGNQRAGLLFGLGAYLLWGVLPLYFKLLKSVSPTEIVAHRILWSLVLLAILVLLWRRWPAIRAAAATSRILMTLAVTALLIAINWLIYIWAVLNGHVLAGSLGYYLNPLVNVLLGVVLLKERLTRGQAAAVALAALGVAVLALRAADGLWISLALASSFGLYGFIRKIAPVDALEGLTIETAMLAPVSLVWILWLQQQGQGGFAAYDSATTALLVLGGAVTAIPLLLFNAAAKRLPYSTLGFLQYIAPSIQFLLAVLVFGETFTPAHALCFAAIWSALLIFAWEGLRLGRARARAAAQCPEPCP